MPGHRPGETSGSAFIPERSLVERLSALILGAGQLEAALPEAELVEPAIPTVRFGVERARDLLLLDVEARGMRLETERW